MTAAKRRKGPGASPVTFMATAYIRDRVEMARTFLAQFDTLERKTCSAPDWLQLKFSCTTKQALALYAAARGDADEKAAFPLEPEAEPAWVGRLVNWKFDAALNKLPEHHAIREKDSYTWLCALSTMFGDCGWAVEGCMGEIIAAAVERILQDKEDA